MTLSDFIEELNIAIKQDGHDVYLKADSSKMVKNLISRQDIDTIIDIAKKLENDFEKCEGGETCFRIDDKEFYTDTGYALDGIRAFVEIFEERIKKLSSY